MTGFNEYEWTAEDAAGESVHGQLICEELGFALIEARRLAAFYLKNWVHLRVVGKANNFSEVA